MKSTETFKNNVIDPVCGMAVNPKNTSIWAIYAGCDYYFCADGCRRAFEINPKKYLKGQHHKRKGLWGRYLDRLEKATGGKPLQCH